MGWCYDCGADACDCNCPQGLQEEYDAMRAAEADAQVVAEIHAAIQPFTSQMAQELAANAHKGDWRAVPLVDLLGPDGELAKHVSKLEVAVVDCQERVWEYAADVANITLMIARAVERGERWAARKDQ